MKQSNSPNPAVLTQHWLFDLGNSRFKCAPLDNDTCGPVQLLEPDNYTALPQGYCAWVASVANPSQTSLLLRHLEVNFSQVRRVFTQAQCLELALASTQAHTFGVDRFLALLAAAQTRKTLLVVGVGTAVTLDLIDSQGQHSGGCIAPSPTTMRQVLHQRATQLPETGGNYGEFADNTPDALASGCIGATIALIERRLERATHYVNSPPQLLLHGGGAKALLPLLPSDAIYRPFLVLEGLARWVRYIGLKTGP